MCKLGRLNLLSIAGFLIMSLLALGSGGSPSSRSGEPKYNSSTTNNATASPTAAPTVSLNETPKTGNTTVKASPCADIESELAGVRRDQASVEEMLDATEDFGPQAGSPKKAIYMNALKRKGELQLQRIALERKLKACGRKK